ncbi:nucleoid-associated protein [Niabella terrae]
MQSSAISHIQALTVHRVGNKNEGEPLTIGQSPVKIDESIGALLSTYFLSAFKSEEYYQFWHHDGLHLHEVHTYVSAIFADPDSLQQQSVRLAEQLYAQSTHPRIKGGEFYVVYFKGIMAAGEPLDGVGLFKSENKDTFLNVYPADDHFEIESRQGININKLDKGCLIFNTEKESGYLVSVVDNTNKGAEARYWIDDFLQLRQRADKYFNTEATLTIYKDYITQQLPESYDISRADQADMLNRSLHFFKDRDSFELETFNQEVLHYPEYINGFNDYKKQYESQRELQIANSFDISDAAVKRQQRHYKSVIKLDKNFHIYIHGDRSQIEEGQDERGRYYKLYFTNET